MHGTESCFLELVYDKILKLDIQIQIDTHCYQDLPKMLSTDSCDKLMLNELLSRNYDFNTRNFSEPVD